MYTYFKIFLLCCIACTAMIHAGAQTLWEPRHPFEIYNDSLFVNAILQRQKNDDVEALNLLDKINTGVPYYNDVLLVKIDIQQAMLNYPEVERLSQELRALGYENVRKANIIDALLFRDNKDYAKAIALLDENISLTPYTDYMSLLGKGMLLYKSERYDEAIPLLEKFVLECFSHHEGHWFLAECYLKQGRLSEALLVYAAGAMLAPPSAVEDFTRRLNQLGEVDNDVLKYFETAEGKNSFSNSDKLLASKVALSKQLKLKTDIQVSWLKQLELVVEENLVKDAVDISHQLYLNLFQQRLIPDLQLYPFVLYYKSNKKITEFVDQHRKYKTAVKSVRKIFNNEVTLISGTRILDAEVRRRSDSIQHWVTYNAGIGLGSFVEIFWDRPVKVADIANKKVSGEQTEFKDGFLVRRINYDHDTATLFYMERGQAVEKQSRKIDSAVYTGRAFNRLGLKILEEQRMTDSFNASYYYAFGQLYGKREEVENKMYKSSVYYPDGQLKASRLTTGDLWWKHDVDTLIKKFDVYGHLNELFVIDRKNRVNTVHRYHLDEHQEQKSYSDNIIIKRRYKQERLLYETKSDGKGMLEHKEFYDSGRLKSELVQYKDIFTERDMILYRRDGTVYGRLNYHEGKLNSGYMLSPENDTLWGAFREQDKDFMKVYDEMGLVYLTIQLGFDGSLFPEMNHYYANGKIKEYHARAAFPKDALFSEIEERFLSGNLKSGTEIDDASGNVLTRYYYPNGNLSREVTEIGKNTSMRETKSFYTNGMLHIKGQKDTDHGYYGDVYLYGKDGHINQVNHMDNGCLTQHRLFVNGKIHYRKELNKGIDTLDIYDSEGRKKGYRLYKDGILYGMGELFYRNRTPAEKIFYKSNGEIDSIARYYPNGTLRRTLKYDNFSRLTQGVGWEITGVMSNRISNDGMGTMYHTYLFESGLRLMVHDKEDILNEVVLVQDKDTLFHTLLHNQGVVEVWCRNEKNMLEKRKIAPDEKQLTVYHTNGNKALVLPLDQYVISGNMELFYFSGKPLLKSRWKFNMLDGEYLWYNPAGRLIEQKYYESGMASQSYRFWDDSGRLLIEGVNYDTPGEQWKYWDAASRKMITEDLVD